MFLLILIINFAFFQIAKLEYRNSSLQQSEHRKTLCGTVFTEKSVYLESPDYPQNYPPNVNCEYVLKNPVECPTYFKFDFVDFRLENSIGCLKDKLEIQDREFLCGKGPEDPKGKVYFSSNGTLYVRLITDGEGSSTGFKILVTRRDCATSENDIWSTTTDITETFETSTLESELSTPPLEAFRPFDLPVASPADKELPHCCLNTYNSRRFLLTSPNFPNTLTTKQECAYQIRKANENICRLRLTFLFFYLGTNNYNNCPNGYVKIDGKLICGCNQDLKLTTAFDTSNFKNIIFKSDGVNLNTQTGFVIEVIQDECPTKYHPAYQQLFANNTSKVINQKDFRFLAPNIEGPSNIEPAQLIHERTEISDDIPRNSKFINIPKLIKRFYYFAEPDYNSFPIEPRESEPTTFTDTSTLNSIVTNFNSNDCMSWNRVQIDSLMARYGNSLQICGRTQPSTGNGYIGGRRSNCVELNYVKGFFKSPGYPLFYPRNLNVCYRFRKQTGYCGVGLLMKDFQIENSYGCDKDYLLLENGNRYCGNRLFGQYLTYDLTTRNYADIVFVTDKFYCGRGFFGIYHQIPCQPAADYPYYPTERPYYPTERPYYPTERPYYPTERPYYPTERPYYPTETPYYPPTTKRPNLYCDRFITEESFVIEVREDVTRCLFQIRRISQNVCKINLYFENFDLFCGSETLLLDNMKLCGHLAGRKISVNFEENNDLIQIIYQSSLVNKYGDFKFRISGQQISNDCLYPEPPVQRFIKEAINEY